MTQEEFMAKYGKAIRGEEDWSDSLTRAREMAAKAQADEPDPQDQTTESTQSRTQKMTSDVLKDQKEAEATFDPNQYVAQGPPTPVDRAPSVGPPLPDDLPPGAASPGAPADPSISPTGLIGKILARGASDIGRSFVKNVSKGKGKPRTMSEFGEKELESRERGKL